MRSEKLEHLSCSDSLFPFVHVRSALTQTVILIELLHRVQVPSVELLTQSMFGFHADGFRLSEGEEKRKDQRPPALVGLAAGIQVGQCAVLC